MPNWVDVAEQAVRDHGAMQDPQELAILLAFLDSSLGPRSVLEIGRGNGGSMWAWSQLPTMELIVSVDQWRFALRPDGIRPGVRVCQVTGDSRDARTVDHVRDLRPDGGYDVVFIDGGHEYLNAWSDWSHYAPLAATWAPVVLHDTRNDPEYPDHDVARLWAQLRSRLACTEIVSRPGGPFGTGIIWDHGDDSRTRPAGSERSDTAEAAEASSSGGPRPQATDTAASSTAAAANPDG